MRTKYSSIGCSVLIAALACPAAGLTQEARSVDFSGFWQRAESAEGRRYNPPESGPGPVIEEVVDGGIRLGDTSNPTLLPHTAAAIEAINDRGRAGEVVHPAWTLCELAGVPLVIIMGDPVQFVQSRDEVTIIYSRGMQVRHVYLNGSQPDDLKPSWYGYSVGHYEGTNSLVIDTRAQNDKALTDRYGSPRSEEIRVVERYTMADDRSAIHVAFMVEDPGAFTTPWKALVTYEPGFDPFVESVCAENNKNPDGGMFPIPRDNDPSNDF